MKELDELEEGPEEEIAGREKLDELGGLEKEAGKKLDELETVVALDEIELGLVVGWPVDEEVPELAAVEETIPEPPESEVPAPEREVVAPILTLPDDVPPGGPELPKIIDAWLASSALCAELPKKVLSENEKVAVDVVEIEVERPLPLPLPRLDAAAVVLATEDEAPVELVELLSASHIQSHCDAASGSKKEKCSRINGKRSFRITIEGASASKPRWNTS